MKTGMIRSDAGRTSWMRGVTVVGALGFASLLSGCGGANPFASGGGSDLTEVEKSRIAESYRDCMAEGGLVGEVSFDGGIDVSVDVPAGIGEAEMLEAEARCEPILEDLDSGLGGGVELTPDEEAELADVLLEVQRCVAEEGYVIDVSDGGISLDSQDQPDPDNFDEVAYLELENECFQEASPELFEKFGPAGG